MLEALALITIFLFLFAIIIVIKGFTKIKLWHALSETPTSSIRGAAVGPIELFGTVSTTTPLKSPLTNSDCLYYRISKNNSVKTLVEESTEFILQDITGKIKINPEGAKFSIFHNNIITQKPSTATKSYTEFIKKHGEGSYSESLLQQNGSVYVYGQYTNEHSEPIIKKKNLFLIYEGKEKFIAPVLKFTAHALIISGGILLIFSAILFLLQ